MLRTSLLLVLSPACLLAQQSWVVPPAQSSTDGDHAYAIAGSLDERRQLTLVDGSLLLPMAGHALTGLTLRRNADERPFAGGDAHWTIRLAHSPRAWNDASGSFAADLGAAPVVVFDGLVTFPSSPGSSGNQVAWTSTNTVAVTFAQPFVYQGGTLAIEITGLPGGTPPDQWVADAVRDVRSGAAQQIGTGCGPFGGALGEWSFVTTQGLVPGATAVFSAVGPAHEFAMWAVAAAGQPQNVNLAAFGAPGCFVHLQAPLAAIASGFGPAAFAQRPDLGGVANVRVQVPSGTAFLGFALASQWFGLGAAGLTASNAHAWQIALEQPVLPMTLVTAPLIGGEASEGKVIPGCGHVFAFTGW